MYDFVIHPEHENVPPVFFAKNFQFFAGFAINVTLLGKPGGVDLRLDRRCSDNTDRSAKREIVQERVLFLDMLEYIYAVDRVVSGFWTGQCIVACLYVRDFQFSNYLLHYLGVDSLAGSNLKNFLFPREHLGDELI